MIEITISEILGSEAALSMLSAQKLPASAAFKIARLIKAIREEMTTINESRVEIANRYGEHDESGKLKIDPDKGSVSIPQEKLNDFVREMEELLMQKISLNASPIPVSTLDNTEMTPQEAEQIYPFLEMNT